MEAAPRKVRLEADSVVPRNCARGAVPPRATIAIAEMIRAQALFLIFPWACLLSITVFEQAKSNTLHVCMIRVYCTCMTYMYMTYMYTSTCMLTHTQLTVLSMLLHVHVGYPVVHVYFYTCTCFSEQSRGTMGAR